MTPLRPCTWTGVDRSVVVPSPSAPWSLSPQAVTVPSDRSARLWVLPAATCTTSLPAAMSRYSVRRRTVVPSPRSPSELSPQLATTWDRTGMTVTRAWAGPAAAMPARPKVKVTQPASAASRRDRRRTFIAVPSERQVRSGGYGAAARRQYRETTVFRLALAAAHEEYHGDADEDGRRGGACHQRVDLAGALADLLHRPVHVLLRAYPVRDGVDGAG